MALLEIRNLTVNVGDKTILKKNNIYSKFDYGSMYKFLDTSYYKGKIYLYFGITPILLFHLPFNLITGMNLTDIFVIFILSCLTFVISLFLIKKITFSTLQSSHINILIVFLIGCCSFLPFFSIRKYIYELETITAVFLLLCAFITLYYYIRFTGVKKSFLVLILGALLSLCVGARPHYVLFIPVFFTSICIINYYQTKNIKHITKQVILFLIPCVIIGMGLAIYNYLRFDSVFEFGWKYQLNALNQYDYHFSFKDFIIGLKNNFFLLPDIDKNTVFSLTSAHELHRTGNDHITGIIWTCPIIISLLFVPNFMKKLYKKNIIDFFFVTTMIFVVFINVFVISFFGMAIRYIYEYLSLMIILSISVYCFYMSDTKDKMLKNFLNIVFLMMFLWSMFINVSLLFCKMNILDVTTDLSVTYFSKVVKFLF